MNELPKEDGILIIEECKEIMKEYEKELYKEYYKQLRSGDTNMGFEAWKLSNVILNKKGVKNNE